MSKERVMASLSMIAAWNHKDKANVDSIVQDSTSSAFSDFLAQGLDQFPSGYTDLVCCRPACRSFNIDPKSKNPCCAYLQKLYPNFGNP